MGYISYQKISRGDFRGWLKEDLCRLLPEAFFDDPESYVRGGGGQTVKESRNRWAAIFPLTEGKSFFVKRDRTKGSLESLKYFFLPSKARKEWFVAYQLQKRNLRVPKPYGWLEKVHCGTVLESYYLSETIAGGVSLIDEAALLKDEKNLKKLSHTVLKLHRSHLFHQDLHAGNFLWDGDSLFLIDLHRARFVSTLSIDRRLWDLAHLFHSLRSVWEEKDHVRFVEDYFGGEPLSLQTKEKYLRKIHSRMGHLQRRQWRSRTKRCLKESTEFSVSKTAGRMVYHLQDFPLERLQRAIEHHHALQKKDPSRLVKQSPEVVVSILEEGKDRICVKQYCSPRFWDSLKDRFRTAKGLQAWISGNGLRVRGVSSLRMFALVEYKSRWSRRGSYLVMEALEGAKEMDRYISEGWKDFRRKRAFIRAFAHWLSDLHHRDVYHQDMKTCNLLVSDEGGGWTFYLLDLEDIHLDERVDERKLFLTFLQINTSVPKAISWTDRLRFYREYQRCRPIVQEDRTFLAQLMEKSRERGIVYVSPTGVVEETLC